MYFKAAFIMYAAGRQDKSRIKVLVVMSKKSWLLHKVKDTAVYKKTSFIEPENTKKVHLSSGLSVVLLQNWQFGVIKCNLLPGIYFIKIWPRNLYSW